MDKIFDDKYLATIAAVRNAIVTLISILATFVFWFAVATTVVALAAFDVLPIQMVKFARSGYGLLALFGISPILLTTVTWKVMSWMCFRFVGKHVQKHFVTDVSV